MYGAVLESGASVSHAIAPGRHAWVQCATGAIEVNGIALAQGDGAAVSDERALTLRGAAAGDAEVILFDLA